MILLFEVLPSPGQLLGCVGSAGHILPLLANHLSLIILLKKLQVMKITTWHNLAPWRTDPWFLLCPPPEIHV